ncbi:MAG: bifunctional 5,10-methylenetetrahydrofolate dehydrogenase/5,10-methenyltetrahydrofolate cyclohydrolase [Oligoflexales bacterium]
MVAKILDGIQLAQAIRVGIKEVVQAEIGKGKRPPCLSVILIGDDPASKVYVNQKKKACQEVGMNSQVHQKPDSITQSELNLFIDNLNKDSGVDGILLQLPIPKHLGRSQSLEMIHPSKDVDGLTSFNQGAILTKLPGLYPCTPLGIMELLKDYDSLRGKRVVLVGYSLLVGAPLSTMLIQEGATVTVLTKASVDPSGIARHADIVIVAAGVKHLVGKNWIKEGAILIDVGIHRDGKVLSGDVDFDDVKSVAGAITPVPGGVGPMTVAFLLKNCLNAYLKNVLQ